MIASGNTWTMTVRRMKSASQTRTDKHAHICAIVTSFASHAELMCSLGFVLHCLVSSFLFLALHSSLQRSRSRIPANQSLPTIPHMCSIARHSCILLYLLSFLVFSIIFLPSFSAAGTVRGPYSAEMMRTWLEHGFLADNLLVKEMREQEFTLLSARRQLPGFFSAADDTYLVGQEAAAADRAENETQGESSSKEERGGVTAEEEKGGREENEDGQEKDGGSIGDACGDSGEEKMFTYIDASGALENNWGVEGN